LANAEKKGEIIIIKYGKVLQLTWLCLLADFGIWLWLLVSQSVSQLLATAAPSTFSDISIYKAQNLRVTRSVAFYIRQKQSESRIFYFASSRGLFFFPFSLFFAGSNATA